MTDDTARRERALLWLNNYEATDNWSADDEWAQESTETWRDWAMVFAYLAGSREEAAIKDAEIERLKYENEALIGCANSIADELAALREAVRWHNHHERGVPMPKAAKEARRRALEE